jgi:hypothetical protein
MPKFHFEIIDGYIIKDPVGIDLNNRDQAKQLAHAIARQVQADAGSTSAREVIVIDDEGAEIYKTAIKPNT